MTDQPFRWTGLFSILLCLCPLWTGTAWAAAPLDATTVKQQIQAHGAGKMIRLDRQDATEIKGALVSIGDESCVLQVRKQAALVTVSYAEVTKVRGPGLSHGAKVGIIVGVCVIAAVGIAAIVIDHKFNAGFPKTIPI